MHSIWMQTLGVICLDLNKMVINFEYLGRRVKLKGIKGPLHSVMEGGVATKELKWKKASLLCQLLPFESLNRSAQKPKFFIKSGINFCRSINTYRWFGGSITGVPKLICYAQGSSTRSITQSQDNIKARGGISQSEAISLPSLRKGRDRETYHEFVVVRHGATK